MHLLSNIHLIDMCAQQPDSTVYRHWHMHLQAIWTQYGTESVATKDNYFEK